MCKIGSRTVGWSAVAITLSQLPTEQPDHEAIRGSFNEVDQLVGHVHCRRRALDPPDYDARARSCGAEAKTTLIWKSSTAGCTDRRTASAVATGEIGARCGSAIVEQTRVVSLHRPQSGMNPRTSGMTPGISATQQLPGTLQAPLSISL